MVTWVREVLLVVLVASASCNFTIAPPRSCSQDVQEFIHGLALGSSAGSGGTLNSCACVFDEETGYTPLHMAATHSSIRIGPAMRVIVRHYGQTTATDRRGATPLHVAAMHGSDIAASTLLAIAAEAGSELRTLIALRRDDGDTALDLAEEGGHSYIARLLIRKNAPRARVTQSVECNYTLVDAVLSDRSSALRSLLAGARGHAPANCTVPPESEGRTLLHLAVSASGLSRPPAGIKAVEVLLEFGANATQPDAQGTLPLAYAARLDRADIVARLLLEMPPNLTDHQDAYGRTALYEASRAGARASAWELLLGGASFDIPDQHGVSPLDMARQEGNAKIVEAMEFMYRTPTFPGFDAAGGSVTGTPSEPTNDASGPALLIVLIVFAVIFGLALAVLLAYVVWQSECWRRLECWCCKRHSRSAVAALPQPSPIALSLEHWESIKRYAAAHVTVPDVDQASDRLAIPPGQVGPSLDDGHSQSICATPPSKVEGDPVPPCLVKAPKGVRKRSKSPKQGGARQAGPSLERGPCYWESRGGQQQTLQPEAHNSQLRGAAGADKSGSPVLQSDSDTDSGPHSGPYSPPRRKRAPQNPALPPQRQRSTKVMTEEPQRLREDALRQQVEKLAASRDRQQASQIPPLPPRRQQI